MVEHTFGEKLETWYDRNGMWINVVITLALVAVIGYKGYQWVHSRNVAKANAAFATALNHYQAGQQNPDAAKKSDELQGAITAAQQVVSDYSDKFVGRQAQLLIGNAQYAIAVSQSGKEEISHLEKARESYNKYLAMAQTDEERAAGNIAVGNVLENLAFIRSDKKVLQEAVDAYNKAAGLAKGTNLAGEAKLAAALAKSGMNDPAAQADAKKLYAEVAENRPVQMISDEAAKAIKPIKLDSGQTLSAEEVAGLKNLAAWSQQQQAKDALAQLK
jgi:predicted negative regulator of RcsB-dependent stress response